jgi:hypothetical protein
MGFGNAFRYGDSPKPMGFGVAKVATMMADDSAAQPFARVTAASPLGKTHHAPIFPSTLGRGAGD